MKPDYSTRSNLIGELLLSGESSLASERCDRSYSSIWIIRAVQPALPRNWKWRVGTLCKGFNAGKGMALGWQPWKSKDENLTSPKGLSLSIPEEAKHADSHWAFTKQTNSDHTLTLPRKAWDRQVSRQQWNDKVVHFKLSEWQFVTAAVRK